MLLKRGGAVTLALRGLRGVTVPSAVSSDFEPPECAFTQDVLSAVRGRLASGSAGRLFAVVAIGGRKAKVTPGDILHVPGNQAFAVGDRLHLPKVTLAGSRDFSLFGRPLLPPGAVTVEATVIEKTLSATLPETWFMRTKLMMGGTQYIRRPQNFLRINAIRIDPARLEDALPDPTYAESESDPEFEAVEARRP